MMDPAGILLVDKPGGMTSHDVVASVRRRGRFRKVGHAGTLDPMATGLLVLLIGKATRSAPLYLHDEKSYDATMTFGFSTETGDVEGKALRHGSYHHLEREGIRTLFKTLQGTFLQTPPMYSAVKQGGQKLYALARKGISVERKPREVTVRVLELKAFSPPTLSFFLTCSKGTYVRALVETIGERLGCPGHLSGLRRIRSGPFSVEEALPLDAIHRLDRDALLEHLRPLRGAHRER